MTKTTTSQPSTIPATVTHVGGCQAIRNTHLASECGAATDPKTITRRFAIKCDECKETIGMTDNPARSAQGGRCEKCKANQYLTCGACGHTGSDVTEESQDGDTVITICASCADAA